MTERLTGAATILTRIMLALALALLGAALLLGVRQNGETAKAFGLAVIAAAVLWKGFPWLTGRLAKLGAVRVWILLTVLCLVLKGAWVVLVRIPLAGDYATFWGYANWLAELPVLNNGEYMALFPHIFGYSSFLSWFIRLFGSGELLAQWLNVLLTALSGSFLFLLARRWWGLAAGISAYLLWIFCPSQTIYNSMVLSEPLYTAMLLGILLLLTRWEDGGKRPILLVAVAGLLLRWLNGVRPIALVVVIALLIWRFLLKPEELGQRQGRRRWLPALVALLAAYLITGPLWQAHLTRRIGEEPATTPGYSVLVGFNPQYNGQWNQEDSDLLFAFRDEPGATAQQAQEKAMAAAKERITSGEISFFHLMKEKVRIFLGTDSACVGYASSVLRHANFFSLACNSFYYAAILLAAVGLIRLWRQGSRSLVLLLPLYVLGLTSAQMLVEVAGRYHYSILPVLLLLGQGALFAPAPAKTKIFQKTQESP